MTSFPIKISFKGSVFEITATTASSGRHIHDQVHRVLAPTTSSCSCCNNGTSANGGDDNHDHKLNEPEQPQERCSVLDVAQLKILYRGKRLAQDDEKVFKSVPSKTPKLIVMATPEATIKLIANKRSDPTVRGLEKEDAKDRSRKAKADQPETPWGKAGIVDKSYRFVKLEACTWHSFGHRPSERTPHAFAAMRLLQKLATDPGIIAVMKDRELVVNTLGEMDPIDDRLMQKQQQQQPGSCLLGYNTNHGLRIDIKLRTDDLQGFRPYHSLVRTLVHELSHNWVGEHNVIFWSNYAQMMAEYLYAHKNLDDTMKLAEISAQQVENIYQYIMSSLVHDMRQHGLHPQLIAAPFRQFCSDIEARPVLRAEFQSGEGRKLGGNGDERDKTPRELALRAAERRAQQKQNENQ